MKDIHEVLRQKQAKYAQLGKQIEMLQQAAEKLREVAPLLAENDDEDNVVLAEVDETAIAGRRDGGESRCWCCQPWRVQGRSAYSSPMALIPRALAIRTPYDSPGITGFDRRSGG